MSEDQQPGPLEKRGDLKAEASFPTENHGDPSKTHLFLASFLLILVTLAVFWPVIGYDFTIFDDPDYFSRNYEVQAGLTAKSIVWAFSTGHMGNWHPLTWLSFMLDAQLFGTGPAGPHFTNLLLHTANSVLVFLILWRLTRTYWQSAIVAALFAVHPLHVEPVAWICERKDVLSTFFGLLALLIYERYARVVSRSIRDELPSSAVSRAPILYVTVLFLFLFSLMSKPMLVTLPFLMLLLDYWPLGRLENPTLHSPLSTMSRLVLEKLPFLLLSIVFCVITVRQQSRLGAIRTFDSLLVGDRIENAFVSYGRYLDKTFWPTNLATPYPYPGQWPFGLVLFTGALVAILCVCAVWLGRRKRYLFVGWFWFSGTLVPVIGVVQAGGQPMADRFTYVPLIGIFIILVWGAGEVLARFRMTVFHRLLAGIAAISIITVCAARARDQLRHWENSDTLFRHAIAVTRDNYIAYVNLGSYAGDKGRLDEAVSNYRKALAISPNGVEALCSLGSVLFSQGKFDDAMELYRKASAANPRSHEALNNLGLVLAEKKQFSEAIDHFKAALQLRPDSIPIRLNLAEVLINSGRIDDAIVQLNEALQYEPNHARVHENLGRAFALKQDYVQAIQQYEDALRLAPNNARTHNDLGLALIAQGKTAEAIEQYEIALRLDPDFVEVHNNLGSALISAGNLDEAIRHFRLLLQRMPEHSRAHDNLGIALAMQGKLAESAAQFEESLRKDPDNANTHFNLGNVLAMQHQYDEAIRQYEETLRLVPEHPEAHCHLGGVLAETGRRSDAIAHLNEALKLKPDYAEARQQLRVLGAE